MAEEPADLQEWHRRLFAGDPAALGDLFAYYRDRLRRLIHCRIDGRVAARVDASDVLQETYLDAARQLPRFLADPKVPVFVWLRGLAWERMLNCERQHLKAACRAVTREAVLPDASAACLADALTGSGSTPSQHLLRAEQRQAVHRALAGLEEKDREVLLLRHLEGLSNNEVAAVLELSPAGASLRHARALLRFQERLSVRGEGTTS
jgi:RNA polymerase sigma-70 factor (ECF subfamily)